MRLRTPQSAKIGALCEQLRTPQSIYTLDPNRPVKIPKLDPNRSVKSLGYLKPTAYLDQSIENTLS
jgi:hypothetical protein